ncbi:extracellular solute-binding protein [Dactylosporangium sp. AC04546]|uniref:ABC transporter substrate-binding protein n=1 Tax=Dactylosporangium sp. AC04546 TaxID=2862460 RepID=UPI001EDCA481|nr:extracellular solute-binding protein [Dactylosporangium sp. AC04546]WVK89745.1 extracellular solute-binding protein [Dactylosporangium sp. AC04546]
MTPHPRAWRPALAALLALTLGAAACSGDSGDGAADDKTLTMWTFKQSHVKALQKVAEGFQKETGITVKVEAYGPDDAYVTKVQAAAQTRNLPDLFEVHTTGDDFAFGAAGLLTDLAKDVDDAWLNSYLPQVRKDGSVTDEYYQKSLAEGSKTKGIQLGQRYSVPLTVGTFGIVYANKQRLADAGVTSAPTTWEQFIEVLAKVKAKHPDNGGVTVGLKAPTTGLEWFLQPMAYGLLGPEKFRALWGKDKASNFSSPTGVQVLETYGQVTPYWTPGTQSLDIDAADLSFVQGKSTFDIGGTFTLAFLAQNGFDATNVLTFPVPAPANGAVKDLSLAPFTLTGMSVSATTKNRAGAIQWLKYLAKADVSATFAKEALDIPPTDLGADPSAAVGPAIGAMIKAFGSGPSAYNPGDTSYRPNAYDGPTVASVLMDYSPLQKRSAADAAAEMTKQIDAFWTKQ